MNGLPDRARVVIIGGGVGGASIAYHLAELGVTDVCLIERDDLTNGSTFHSAGLVGQLRGSVVLTKMMMYSVELYSSLAKDPETDPGWIQSGGIRLACTAERHEELKRQVGWARTFGLPLEEISPSEAQELFPLMSTEGVRAATYLPTDGYLDPSQLTRALARVAKSKGINITTGTRVEAIEIHQGAVNRVITDKGSVETEIVVNAAGMYAAAIGRMAGVRIPVTPFSHQYLVTAGFREAKDQHRLPTLRDPDLLVYFREDARGLVMGGYERHSRAAFLDDRRRDRIPPDFNGKLLEEDWERFEEITVNSARRVPVMADVPIRRLVNGPEGFTPDNEFCLGETEVRGFFVAAGFCAHGIAGAGGIGKVMASWIVDKEPPMDLWEMDIRRFGPQYRSFDYTLARTRETYETYYDIIYPNHERNSGRPLKVSPLYEWHEQNNAEFGEKSGWERVNYYRSNEDNNLEYLRPKGWAGINWSTAIAREHLATRESAGLFDESSFAKIEVTGPDSGSFLERLCDNQVARGIGRITYTQMLNSRGGIECDFTVTRLGEERFMIVTGTAFGRHDLAWITSHVGREERVEVRDITSSLACIALWGPKARRILSKISPDDLSNSAFPYMSAKEIVVAGATVLALRVTFVGELGWELYLPPELARHVWNALLDAGKPEGMICAGYRAIDSLRMEKGYRVWASDITGDDTPFEAGLDFCVRMEKPHEFIGKDALGKSANPARKLVGLRLTSSKAVALGNEPVLDGEGVIGRVTSGNIGYSVGESLALAYVPVDRSDIGTRLAVSLFGELVTAEVVAMPVFDPGMKRIKADG